MLFRSVVRKPLKTKNETQDDHIRNLVRSGREHIMVSDLRARLTPDQQALFAFPIQAFTYTAGNSKTVAQVMPKQNHTDLVTYLNNQSITGKQIKGILNDIISSVKALRQHGYVSLDLKLDNFLVTADGHAKLTDHESLYPFGAELPYMYGTTGYMAPELVTLEATPSMDLYALAAIIEEIGSIFGCLDQVRSIAENLRSSRHESTKQVDSIINNLSKLLDQAIRNNATIAIDDKIGRAHV